MVDKGTLIYGLVESTTFTTNDALDIFPAASEDEQLTSVDPSGNVEPEAGVHVVATSPSTKSDAVAEYVTGAPDAVAVPINKISV